MSESRINLPRTMNVRDGCEEAVTHDKDVSFARRRSIDQDGLGASSSLDACGDLRKKSGQYANIKMLNQHTLQEGYNEA